MASPVKVQFTQRTATIDPLANGAALLLLAAYLSVVLATGNFSPFLAALKQDLFTRSAAGPAFWQWLIALIVLYALAKNPATSQIFGPLLGVALVAMLIQLALKNPQSFNALDNNIRYLLGGGTIHRS